MKARAYYYEGMINDLKGDMDAGYECYKRAISLDPDNADVLYAVTVRRSTLDNDAVITDSLIRAEVQSLRRYVDKYPDDLYEGMNYAYIAGMVDTTGADIQEFERLAERFPDKSQILIYLSQAYHQHGKTDKAIDAMNRYEKIEGKSAPLTLHKMSMRMENGDTVGAMQEVDKLIASDPGEYSYLILKGNLYDVMAKPDSARQLYLEAERMAPESSAPKMALMETYRTAGDSVAYDKKVYEVLLTEDMEVGEKTQLLAQYLQRLVDENSDTGRGDYLFSVLQEQYPRDPEVLSLSARYNAAKGNFAVARDAISYAIDMDPKNMDYRQMEMYYLVREEKADEAVAVYEKTAREMEMPVALRAYGGVLMQNAKRYSEARGMFERIIHDIDSGLRTDTLISLRQVRRDITLEDLNLLSDMYVSLGNVAVELKDTVQSMMDFTNAMELNPDNSLAANNYAYFAALSGNDLEKALELSRRSLRGENADNPTYLDTYAWILYLRGDNDKALEVQKHTIELMEKSDDLDKEALSHYGHILYKSGDVDNAVIYWKKALELDPDNVELKELIRKNERKE